MGKKNAKPSEIRQSWIDIANLIDINYDGITFLDVLNMNIWTTLFLTNNIKRRYDLTK